MRFLPSLCRSVSFLLALCCAPLLSAKVVWLVGQGAAVDAPAVATQLSHLLNDEAVEVVPFKWLSTWINTPDTDGVRAALLEADSLLVTLSPAESERLAFLGLTSLKALRPKHLQDAAVVAVQKPVYKMSGLCENSPLQRLARLAIGADLTFIALPKVWQRVYTDDTFYNKKVPKGAGTESYVAAAGIARVLKGEDFEIAPLSGIHPSLAEDLLDSIDAGLELGQDVIYAAQHLPAGGFDVRVGVAFDAILYDGAFERKIGDWLEAFALADGRKLTLHYTKDTTIDTGWPCLFRTVHTLGKMPNASVYTRPAFEDDSGLTELQHLEMIYAADANKPGWLPFPLAIAEWVRRCPNKPVYKGAEPTEATAAMFAAMLYLKWTGAAVLPPTCDQEATTAISIGIDTMLRQQRLRRDVNAIFCRPLGKGRFAFSLWRATPEKVIVNLDTDDAGKAVSTKKLVFTKDNFWSPQTVTVDTPCTFFWKISAKNFPGQNTGARVLE